MTDKSPVQILLSSTTATLLVSTVTNPLDVIKVRIQNNAPGCESLAAAAKCTSHAHGSHTHYHNHSIGKASVYRLLFTPNLQQTYNVLCDCLPFRSNTKSLIYLTRKEGFGTLTNGLSQGLIGAMLGTVTYFYTYETVRSRVKKYTDHHVAIPLASALSARFITTCVAFPFEYMRTIQQSTIGAAAERPSFKTATKINAGFGSLMGRDLLFSGMYWVLAENIRRGIKALVHEKEEGYNSKQFLLLSNVIAGGTSGAIASATTIPLDVVKTRKQLNPKEYSNKSTFSILRHIYYNESPNALFAGMRQRVTKVTLSCAGMLTLYEFFSDAFRAANLH